MKAPSLTDRKVAVTAYLTDEVFGYDHWRAAQFCAKPGKPAVLLIFDTDMERDAVIVDDKFRFSHAFEAVEARLRELEQVRDRFQQENSRLVFENRRLRGEE